MVVASALTLAGCGGTPHGAATAAPDSTATPASPAASGTTGALQPISAASLVSLAGDGQARVTIVNVWATWCKPCRDEFPELLEAARAHRAEGVRLLLVSADFEEQIPDIHQFLAAQGVTDTTYLKHDGDQTFIDTLNPGWTGSIPATFVYDGAGRRIAFWEGRADRARFEAAIQQALTAAPGTNKERS